MAPRNILVLSKKKLIDTYFIISIILFTGAVLTLIGDVLGTASPQGDPLQRGVYLLIYVLMLPLLIIEHRFIYKLLISDKLISLILFISILSISWSALPLITSRRVIALILTTLFGIIFSRYYNLEGQINILTIGLGVIVILCLVFPILFPDLGIHQTGVHEGRWRGVFVQKNTMASILVFAVMIFVYKLRSSKKNRLIVSSLLIMSFSLLILSWSTTAFISLVFIYIAVNVFTFYAKLSRRNVIINLAFLFILVGALTIYLFNNLDFIFGLFGKDVTLSGRIPLWIILFEMIQDKLLLGYGYEAFWNGQGSPSMRVINQLFWIPNDAHNGYIDIVLSIGIIGFALVVLKVIELFKNTKSLFNINKNAKYLIVISMIVYVLLLNVTSTSILVQNSIFWILLVSLSAGIKNEKLLIS